MKAKKTFRSKTALTDILAVVFAFLVVGVHLAGMIVHLMNLYGG